MILISSRLVPEQAGSGLHGSLQTMVSMVEARFQQSQPEVLFLVSNVRHKCTASLDCKF